MTTSRAEGIPGADGLRPRLAVVGGGVAGIVAAWSLRNRADVTLFENQSRLGGHTHTVVVPDGPDAGVGVDTGFIVLNDHTYPHLHAFLKELDVPVRYSDMSFGYHDEVSGFQYSGRGLRGLFADPGNALRPDFWKMVADFRRFNRQGLSDLGDGRIGSIDLGEYLRQGRYSRAFVQHYLVPMGAAIWSTSNEDMLDFPAAVFLHFFQNHGLLQVAGRPHWQTVVGGSHAYVKRFRSRFPGRIVEGASIEGIERGPTGVAIHRANAALEEFDGVVVAVHADQVLPLLRDADQEEKRIFSPWRYQENHAVLHHDTSVLPSRPWARASWNFTREPSPGSKHPVSITYDSVRLQGLKTHHHWMVTLNRNSRIDPSSVLREMVYHHPTFTLGSLASRDAILARNGTRRTWFTGSYFGFGFHEDAVRASVEMARTHFGGAT